MVIIHPIQAVVTIGDNSVVFTVVKNVILAYRKECEQYKLIGKWLDHYDRTNSIKEKVTNEQERQIAENAKKQKDNEGHAIKKKTDAKVPIPGLGAPPVYACIRNLLVSKNGDKLFSCADSDKSILIFNIDLENGSNCLQLIKRQSFPKRPNAITISDDEKTVVMADKFGDVYSIPVEGEPVQNINEELEPILGHVSMLTDILFKTNSEGKRFLITTDRDEHIKISHFPQCFIVDKWLFGHDQFISSVCSPQWKSNWLFSAGGDDFVFLWNWESGEQISKFDYSGLIKSYLNDAHLAPVRFQNEENNVIEYSVSKIVATPTAPFVSFFVEATKILFIVEVNLENGSLSLKDRLEFPSNIISLNASTDDGLVISLDNRESNNREFIKFITLNNEKNKFEINEKQSESLDICIRASENDDDITVEKDGVYPLYSITTLRKHGEHYS